MDDKFPNRRLKMVSITPVAAFFPWNFIKAAGVFLCKKY
jgi:hypothetical protein